VPKVSVIIPAYNEARYIKELISKIVAIPIDTVGYEREIIVVDDGSSDGTYEIAASCAGVKAYRQTPNQGKGKAVQFGISQATGDFVLVQDADLEYDPNDYLVLLAAVPNSRTAVYGSRILGQLKTRRSWLPGKHPRQSIGPYVAGLVLSLWTFLLYGRWLTDTLTAYKLYPRSLFEKLEVKTAGFETDHEITAGLIRLNYEIVEVPIHYEPRTIAEGKKIKARDGAIALWTLFRFRWA
jgi:glycosyltransferase involved in cell wall biosynthesis